MTPMKKSFDGSEFYDFVKQYKLAMFCSSLEDDCVHYIYVDTADLNLEFNGKKLYYIISATQYNVDGDCAAGIIIKGTQFDCEILDVDGTLSLSFKSEMMSEGPSYLVLKK